MTSTQIHLSENERNPIFSKIEYIYICRDPVHLVIQRNTVESLRDYNNIVAMLQVCLFSTVITLYKNMYWTRLSKTHLGFLFFHGHMPKEEVCCSAVQKKRRVQIDSMCVQGKDKYLQALGFLAQLPRFLLGIPYLFTIGYSHLTDHDNGP